MKSIALKKIAIITTVLLITASSVFAFNGGHNTNHRSGNHNGSSHNSGCYTDGSLNHNGADHYMGSGSMYRNRYDSALPFQSGSMGENIIKPTKASTR